MKIKSYRNLKEYSEQNGICRQTASSRFKKGELNIIRLPEFHKYVEIVKEKENN